MREGERQSERQMRGRDERELLRVPELVVFLLSHQLLLQVRVSLVDDGAELLPSVLQALHLHTHTHTRHCVMSLCYRITRRVHTPQTNLILTCPSTGNIIVMLMQVNFD